MEKEANEASKAKEKEDEVQVEVEISHSELCARVDIDVIKIFCTTPLILLRSPTSITSLLLAETF